MRDWDVERALERKTAIGIGEALVGRRKRGKTVFQLRVKITRSNGSEKAISRKLGVPGTKKIDGNPPRESKNTCFSGRKKVPGEYPKKTGIFYIRQGRERGEKRRSDKSILQKARRGENQSRKRPTKTNTRLMRP